MVFGRSASHGERVDLVWKRLQADGRQEPRRSEHHQSLRPALFLLLRGGAGRQGHSAPRRGRAAHREFRHGQQDNRLNHPPIGVECLTLVTSGIALGLRAPQVLHGGFFLNSRQALRSIAPSSMLILAASLIAFAPADAQTPAADTVPLTGAGKYKRSVLPGGFTLEAGPVRNNLNGEMVSVPAGFIVGMSVCNHSGSTGKAEIPGCCKTWCCS